MVCPHCHRDNDKIVNSRTNKSYTRRRRECLHCNTRWTTIEKMAEDPNIQFPMQFDNSNDEISISEILPEINLKSA